MFCTKCGAKCADNTRFCERCGSPLIPPAAPSGVSLNKELPRDTIDEAFEETVANMQRAQIVPPSVPAQPVPPPMPQQPYRPVPPPMPVQRRSGGAAAVVLILVLLLAAVVGGLFIFRARSANEMDLEGNLAQLMWDYCLPDIEDHYDDVMPEKYSENGYTVNQRDSSFRIQPAKKQDTFTVSGRFDVTDKTRDDVSCRVNVEGTVSTDFMRNKYTWDLDYDFEDPPAAGEDPEMMPADAYDGDGGGWGDMPADPPEYYIWPTDTQYITYNDLYGFSRYEIMLMRNELYARYGCSFQDDEIRSYFLDQSWYTPNPDMLAVNFGLDQFTEIERTNLETILSYEKEQGWRK